MYRRGLVQLLPKLRAGLPEQQLVPDADLQHRRRLDRGQRVLALHRRRDLAAERERPGRDPREREPERLCVHRHVLVTVMTW